MSSVVIATSDRLNWNDLLRRWFVLNNAPMVVPVKPIVVLVIEEEMLTLLKTCETLESDGFAVIAALNSRDALQTIQSRSDIRLIFANVNAGLYGRPCFGLETGAGSPRDYVSDRS
jgi:PleD family two-component response regulator